MMNIRIEVELPTKENAPKDAPSIAHEELERANGISVVARVHFVVTEEALEDLHLYPFRVVRKGDQEAVVPNIDADAKPFPAPAITFWGGTKKRLDDHILLETKRLLKKVN